MREPIQTCMWRWLPRTGLERCALSREGGDWVLEGSILTVADEQPVEARYEVRCDPAWATRSVDVRLVQGVTARSLRLAVRGGRWYEGQAERESVRGCLDVDLGWSPSTNTLPIRRLGLEVGSDSGPLTMAWVRFPELTVEPLAQEYRRLAERTYRYTSRGGTFTAEVEVDAHGLVVAYEGVWQRV
jgi:hypothetical protein